MLSRISMAVVTNTSLKITLHVCPQFAIFPGRLMTLNTNIEIRQRSHVSKFSTRHRCTSITFPRSVTLPFYWFLFGSLRVRAIQCGFYRLWPAKFIVDWQFSLTKLVTQLALVHHSDSWLTNTAKWQLWVEKFSNNFDNLSLLFLFLVKKTHSPVHFLRCIRYNRQLSVENGWSWICNICEGMGGAVRVCGNEGRLRVSSFSFEPPNSARLILKTTHINAPTRQRINGPMSSNTPTCIWATCGNSNTAVKIPSFSRQRPKT